MMVMLGSFKHAFHGIAWAFRNHPNFRIHIVISFCVLALALGIPVTRQDFAILIFAIILGLVIEMTNTAVEEVTNLITIKWAHQAKVAKDVGAGMMFLTAIGTAIIGLIIFIPYLI